MAFIRSVQDVGHMRVMQSADTSNLHLRSWAAESNGSPKDWFSRVLLLEIHGSAWDVISTTSRIFFFFVAESRTPEDTSPSRTWGGRWGISLTALRTYVGGLCGGYSVFWTRTASQMVVVRYTRCLNLKASSASLSLALLNLPLEPVALRSNGSLMEYRYWGSSAVIDSAYEFR
jgi:hypothetical protein